MSDMRQMLVEQTERLLAEYCTEKVIVAAEGEEWPAALWRELEVAGLPLTLVDESAGGVGADLGDAAALMRLCGRFAVPVPIAESMIANWLWTRAGGEAMSGPASFGPASGALKLEKSESSAPLVATESTPPSWGRAREGGTAASAQNSTQPGLQPQGFPPPLAPPHKGEGSKQSLQLNGTAPGLATANVPMRFILLADTNAGPRLVRLNVAEHTTKPFRNVGGDARIDLECDGAQMPAANIRALPGGLLPDDIRRLGALMRAAQMVGAMERALELSVAYVNQRVQFGRPLAKFQAIQHQLAAAASELAAAGATVDAAAELAPGEDGFAFWVAVAKVRAGAAAGIVAATAHQVHGAIGFTKEYSLHFATRRLWAWRDEFGTEAEWARELGQEAIALGKDGLWGRLTEG